MDFLIVSILPLKWSALLTAMACGSIIGLERQLAGKPAGIRTSCLICIGTYVFVASGVGMNSAHVDPSRVVSQVVTGVGFLGAGVMMARDGAVIGVTSAATIWVLAAIGVQIGLGHHLPAVALSVLVVLILVGVNILENSFINLQRGVHRHIASLRRRSDPKQMRRESDTENL